jgi:ribosomal protein S19
MARAVWKGPFVEESLIKKVEKLKQIKNQLKLGQENQQSYPIL